MKQTSFADAEFAAKKRVTRRERFLGEMERLVPWAALLGFRHLLEEQGLTERIFATFNAGLRARGLMQSKGTVVDATIIAAPPSTKHWDKVRDPEMNQAKKGNQWHCGMKAHIGVDAAQREELKGRSVTWHIAMKRGRASGPWPRGPSRHSPAVPSGSRPRSAPASSTPFLWSRTSSVTARSATRG
jgi:IS5 family transposase